MGVLNVTPDSFYDKGKFFDQKNAENPNPILQHDGPVCPLKVAYPRVLFDGFFVGILTGLVGVGGGFLIVPALVMLVGLPMPAAIGTSLLVIVMNAVAGLGGYANHAAIDLSLTAVVTGGAVAGSVIGGILSTQISAAVLRRLFGLFVIMVAGYVLYQSLTLELLTNLLELLKRHVEFVLGFATLAVGLALLRIGQRIHQKVNDKTSHSESQITSKF